MTTSGIGHIFISYRRADSAPWAGRIYDRLMAHFGKDAIFMDVDTIEAGVDFVEVLQKAVQSCDVLVALIGRRWLDIKDAEGKRRLDNPEDFVRIEVAAALERGIRVIPVLVDGVMMPHSTELPENLKLLARRNALQVNHHSFNADARRLISQLELALKAAEDSRILKARKVEEEKARREKEEAEKARLEEEERKRKEAEEKARKEKEARDKAVAEDHTRLAAKQKAKKEREEWERKVAEEKAQRVALRKARLGETAERIRNTISGGSSRPFFVGGGIVILIFLGYIIKTALAPSMPVPPIGLSATTTLQSALSTEILFTPTLASTETPTEIPPSPTPSMGVGSTMISEKDGMTLVYVPAGEFEMGSEHASDDEKPVHTVYLDAFWIDQTELTNEMFAEFIDETGYETYVQKIGTSLVYFNDRGAWFYLEGTDWQHPSGPESSIAERMDYPVVHVSWNDANAYCEWAGRRLPTEAEWEKVAGWDSDAGVQRTYPWGNSFDDSYANYNGTVGDTSPVGSYRKGVSFYNAYDMAGNVREWVSSLYQPYPYNANDGREDLSGEDARVLRGGSWASDRKDIRSTSRHNLPPIFVFDDLGFRCARDADSP